MHTVPGEALSSKCTYITLGKKQKTSEITNELLGYHTNYHGNQKKSIRFDAIGYELCALVVKNVIARLKTPEVQNTMWQIKRYIPGSLIIERRVGAVPANQ